tara:strand:- start:7718 stop:8818 length:1101 start_codon:yes stop_codon:yes gene_type:complete
MDKKNLFYFISNCLTLSSQENNKNFIKKKLKSNSINWDDFVKVSSYHYVLPALYHNFKAVDFLRYLPDDLVNYMKTIMLINQNRNKEILKQVNEINNILRKENIEPIFLKGAGNILSNLYNDNSERMIGDIDFIVSDDDYLKSVKIMIDNGYEELFKIDYNVPIFKHYPRLVKKNKIAAIEIHKELTIKKYSRHFNYSFIKSKTINLNGFQVLGYSDMLILSIISGQINDDRYYYKTISLKNAYDVFLLSKKVDIMCLNKFLGKLRRPVTTFIYISYNIFNKIPELKFIKSSKTERDFRLFNNNLNNSIYTKIRFKIIRFYLHLISRFNLLINCIIYSEYREWLFNRISDKNWQNKKINQLGIKKN